MQYIYWLERGSVKIMESMYLDPDVMLDEGSRGRYYKFETATDGSVVLKPVKVPAHVIEERKARIRKKQMERRVQHNREQAAIMNKGFVAFMAVALVICCIVCYFFISLQGEVTTRLRTVAALQSEVQAVTIDNDTLEKRLAAQEDVAQVKVDAADALGMQVVSPDQIIYYSVSEQDYMLQYDEVD